MPRSSKRGYKPDNEWKRTRRDEHATAVLADSTRARAFAASDPPLQRYLERLNVRAAASVCTHGNRVAGDEVTAACRARLGRMRRARQDAALEFALVRQQHAANAGGVHGAAPGSPLPPDDAAGSLDLRRSSRRRFSLLSRCSLTAAL